MGYQGRPRDAFCGRRLLGNLSWKSICIRIKRHLFFLKASISISKKERGLPAPLGTARIMSLTLQIIKDTTVITKGYQKRDHKSSWVFFLSTAFLLTQVVRSAGASYSGVYWATGRQESIQRLNIKPKAINSQVFPNRDFSPFITKLIQDHLQIN